MTDIYVETDYIYMVFKRFNSLEMRFLILFAIISLFDVTTGYQRPKRFFRMVTGSITGSDNETYYFRTPQNDQ